VDGGIWIGLLARERSMPGQMILQIWDVQHGACAMLTHEAENGVQGRLAMIDSGDNGETG
jgi:hypothetical protein